MLLERKINNFEVPITNKIVPDGTAMRTLGAWVGNGSNTDPQWNAILERQKKILDTWKTTHLSYKGKELILKSLVISIAFYLATVNGMSDRVRKAMKKMMKDFLWDDRKTGYMQWENVTAPKSEGGLNMPDLDARLDVFK